LVARECLGGEHVEGACARIACERFEHGQVEAEALAARRGRGDDEVAPAESELERLGLVRVELGDAARGEGTAHGEPERGGKGTALSTRRLVRRVGRQARLHVPGREPPRDDGVDAARNLPG
jgi:hypothetical protein